jgi:hypothetical protein
MSKPGATNFELTNMNPLDDELTNMDDQLGNQLTDGEKSIQPEESSPSPLMAASTESPPPLPPMAATASIDEIDGSVNIEPRTIDKNKKMLKNFLTRIKEDIDESSEIPLKSKNQIHERLKSLSSDVSKEETISDEYKDVLFEKMSRLSLDLSRLKQEHYTPEPPFNPAEKHKRNFSLRSFFKNQSNDNVTWNDKIFSGDENRKARTASLVAALELWTPFDNYFSGKSKIYLLNLLGKYPDMLEYMFKPPPQYSLSQIIVHSPRTLTEQVITPNHVLCNESYAMEKMLDSFLKDNNYHVNIVVNITKSLGRKCHGSEVKSHQEYIDPGVRYVENVSTGKLVPQYRGGSKSRRRHRRKPARKTRRGRTRKSKVKSKTKTHRHRRHSRLHARKHKKYTRRCEPQRLHL